MASAQQQLEWHDAKVKATPPQTPAEQQLAAAQRAELAYEAKLEAQAVPGIHGLQLSVLRKSSDWQLIDLKTKVRRAELQVYAEQQVAVPIWDSVIGKAQAKFQDQETAQAQLAAQSAQKRTVQVATIGAAALALLVLTEVI